MSGKDLIVDLRSIDFSNIVADLEEIRRHNPQRDAMEQLTKQLGKFKSNREFIQLIAGTATD